MLHRLGLAGRLMAIVFFLLLALWILGVGWAYVWQAPGVQRGHLPLPKQAAAIIAVIESAAPRQREVVLDAVNSEALSVTLVESRPLTAPDAQRLSAVEWIVARYVEAFGNREVIALLEPAPGSEFGGLAFGARLIYSEHPLRLAISLKTGGYAVFETRGEIVRRLFGFPPGFWLGALGSLIGVAAIVAVMREARPLTELARAVGRFRGDPEPINITSRGAPEIGRLVDAFNEMQRRIAALVKGRNVFFGAVSHDLKTYITRLRLRAESIDDDTQRSKAVRDLDEMTLLIDDALAVARSAATVERREAVDLAELLRSEVEERSGSHVVFVAPPSSAQLLVDADEFALRRVFANIIGNALQFATACRVSIETGPGRVAVLIDDNGPGIPVEERFAVLEPFYRLEPSRNRATGGSGLGLAIARQIIADHGGSIAIETSPLGGARVRTELPSLQRPKAG